MTTEGKELDGEKKKPMRWSILTVFKAELYVRREIGKSFLYVDHITYLC